VRTIGSIPLKLKEAVGIIVEGEIWLSKKDFLALNKERQKNDEPLYANPRNIAAGTIRQLDSQLVAKRPLDSFIYDVAYSTVPVPETQYQELEYLKSLGFKVDPHFAKFADIEGVVEYWQDW